MDTAEEKFFESLARSGGKKKQSEPEEDEPETVTLHVPKSGGVRKEELGEDTSLEPEGQLTLDVYQTADDIVVQSAIAGVKPDDIDIDVTNDSITIRGERRKEERVKDEDYFYQECYWGRFSRSVILPQEVDPERAAVSFKNGVLTVKLPKANRRKSRKLKVKFE